MVVATLTLWWDELLSTSLEGKYDSQFQSSIIYSVLIGKQNVHIGIYNIVF